MFGRILLLSFLLGFVCSAPQKFDWKYFKVGIEYHHSLPMCGGSDRYRHRNNCDPFFVTVTASAKKGFVISYIEVKAVVDEGGYVDFNIIRGNSGSRDMVFQLVSNHSDFLSYSYLAYGIREEEFKKIINVINVPIGNNGINIQVSLITFIISALIYRYNLHYY